LILQTASPEYFILIQPVIWWQKCPKISICAICW